MRGQSSIFGKLLEFILVPLALNQLYLREREREKERARARVVTLSTFATLVVACSTHCDSSSA